LLNVIEINHTFLSIAADTTNKIFINEQDPCQTASAIFMEARIHCQSTDPEIVADLRQSAVGSADRTSLVLCIQELRISALNALA